MQRKVLEAGVLVVSSWRLIAALRFLGNAGDPDVYADASSVFSFRFHILGH